MLWRGGRSIGHCRGYPCEMQSGFHESVGTHRPYVAHSIGSKSCELERHFAICLNRGKPDSFGFGTSATGVTMSRTGPKRAHMTDDRSSDPRCDACQAVLPRSGAMCTVCDGDALFEGAPRTAPPIATPFERHDDILGRTAGAQHGFRVMSA